MPTGGSFVAERPLPPRVDTGGVGQLGLLPLTAVDPDLDPLDAPMLRPGHPGDHRLLLGHDSQGFRDVDPALRQNGRIDGPVPLGPVRSPLRVCGELDPLQPLRGRDETEETGHEHPSREPVLRRQHLSVHANHDHRVATVADRLVRSGAGVAAVLGVGEHLIDLVLIETDVCVAGGGPAGMMLGLLLAHQGIDVRVLEKHADFFRDFRGDTMHPSTMQVLDQLGLGPAIAAVPHRDVSEMRVHLTDGTFLVADFSRLRVDHPYIRFMPQWDVLTVLAESAERLPRFRLLREHEVTDLRRRGGVTHGVRADTPKGPIEVEARLTVAADGRNSVVRERSGLPVRQFGAPMDVLWFRLSRRDTDPAEVTMHIGAGRLMVAIDRGDYWQLAYVIAKGGEQGTRAAGIEAFRQSIANLIPALAGRVHEIASFDQVATLTVRVDKLRRWHAPGLLCIGDAAHAMSPVGGVGINLAIQDAVAAARLLREPLRVGPLTYASLAAVQARRTFPTFGTQLIQRLAQRFLVAPALAATGPVYAPAPLRLLSRLPRLQTVPARVVGIGRPESLS